MGENDAPRAPKGLQARGRKLWHSVLSLYQLEGHELITLEQAAPVLRVNPISAIAPGLLRKFFEFPSGNAPAHQSYADPAR